METLPTLFKQAREKKGISLKDAEAATRIPPRYLEVLEGRGDRRLLADYAYLIPFVRTYAAFLGLDPTTAVTQFITELQGLESKEIQSERSAPPTRSSPWTLPLFSLLILLVVFLYLWQRNEPPSRTQEQSLSPPLLAEGSPQERSAEFPVSPPASPPPTPSEEPPVSSPPPETAIAKATIPQDSPTAVPSQSPQPATAPESQASPSPADTSHLLRVEAKEPTWIRVVIDNQQQKDVLLQPGEKVEWTAKGGFNLTVGNAGGVTLNLNGQDLPPLGKSGQVLRNIQLPAAGSSASDTPEHRSSIAV